jgi:uncharacterized membrane protein YdcZ (DUF606 family)
MDYLKENHQVAITQIVTVYVFGLMVSALSVDASFHSKSPLVISSWSIVAIATIAAVVYWTRKIGDSLKA